jgi:hypothetical protein
MKTIVTPIAIAALLALSGAATAQVKSKPGQSEYAPGHQPGDAKKSAPGQRMHKKDNPKYPGASEYAPGQQPKSGRGK